MNIKRTCRFNPLLVAATALGILVAGPSVVSAAPVGEVSVRVTNGYPLDKSSVLLLSSQREGSEFSRRALARDVRALEKTGRFSYVATEVLPVGNEVAVTFVVTPRLHLRRLSIEGAEYYSRGKIRKLLGVSAGSFIDEDQIRVKAYEVEQKYHDRYYPDARVQVRIEPVEGTMQADLYVQVVEGEKSMIRAIDIEGNTHLSDRKIRKVMEQKKAGFILFRIFTQSGSYEKGLLDADVLAIQELYRSKGYLNVLVEPPQISRPKESRMEVTIEVDEGPLYEVGTIRLEGVSTLPEERVYEEILLKTGDVASSTAIEQTRQAIQDYYLSQGYYRTIVREKLLADPMKPVVDIVYEVREGRLSRVRDVDFSGNVRTHDKVIRREVGIAPGEIFNQVKVRTSTARLRNLNYFSYVNPIISPTNREDEYDVVFQLEEQRTGSFIGGVGVSSIDDLIGFVELSQSNFDIFGWPHPTGAGQKVKVRFTLGTSRRDYEVSFIEPWFLDRRLRLSVDGFQHDRRFLSDDYDQRNTGASVGLSKSLATYYTGSVKYALEKIEVRNVARDASDLIKIEEGDQIQSSLTFSLQRDTRNRVFVPTAGSRTRAQVKVAGGPLGGDSELYEIQLKNASFIPLWFDHVLSLRGVVSVVEPYGGSSRVPIFDRLFQGGARTIRGFDFRDVGPRDERGEPIGGQSEFQYTVEYSIPISDQFRFATFYDAGNVWADGYDWDFGDLNSSYGIGLRIDIPGFPLQLDYSWPIEADEFNDRSGGRFSFLIGYFY